MSRKFANLNIVELTNFIQATRDAGYKGIVNALAELVDNSLDANARNISIIVEGWGTSETKIIVADDGDGMDPKTLQLALQFGGSGRFDSRTGIGRFGMGLPNGSLSQAKRVEVFTWQDPDEIWWGCLDVDEIVAGRRISLQNPKRIRRMPCLIERKSAGTVVVWSKCDRIKYKNWKTFIAHVASGLGRIYRRPIGEGITISVCGETIVAIDPLLTKSCNSQSVAITSEPPLNYEIEFGYNNGIRKTSSVLVKFACLPIEEWHSFSNEQKQAFGISKGAGVSILRAGREIDFGWFFMGKKRKENYDDWWRCEVSFEPDLDEMFGVTNTKQGIRPTEQLKSILAPDMEAIAHSLNRSVRKRFAALKAETHLSNGAKQATRRDLFLRPPVTGGKVDPETIGISSTPVRELKTKYPIKGLSYRIIPKLTDDKSFFVPILNASELLVFLNPEHPFFECVYQPLMQSSSSEGRQLGRQVELMILAAARAECGLVTDEARSISEEFRREWSRAFAMFLD